MSSGPDYDIGAIITLSGFLAAVLALVFSVAFIGPCATQADVTAACGPCDHVAKCGRFRCEAGREGWRKVATP